MDKENLLGMLDEIHEALEDLQKKGSPVIDILCTGDMPRYATEGSAGMDLAAANEEPIVLAPKTQAEIPTGIHISIPKGYFGALYPRSGAGIKKHLALSNTVGVIDSDYRGEIKIFLYNYGDEPVTVEKGDRIVQMIIQPYARFPLHRVTKLDETERGEGGFGSTGDK